MISPHFLHEERKKFYLKQLAKIYDRERPHFCGLSRLLCSFHKGEPEKLHFSRVSTREAAAEAGREMFCRREHLFRLPIFESVEL